MAYVRDRAAHLRALARKGGSPDAGEDRKWGLVVQDCFSGGMVPGELFTVEFWQDLKVGMKSDGIVAVVCLRLSSVACHTAVGGLLVKWPTS
jgi:spermidine synthase